MKRFLHGRALTPLIGPWIACLTAAALVYMFERAMPAFHDIVKIVYFIIGVLLAIITGRALRSRMSKRRQGERRQREDRRGHED
jgi:membrane protein implicated in regulation of membrane protease activity